MRAVRSSTVGMRGMARNSSKGACPKLLRLRHEAPRIESMTAEQWVVASVWLGASFLICAVWPWRLALLDWIGTSLRALDQRLVWRPLEKAQGWRDAPPPPSPLEARETALSCLENPVVRGMVIGREKGEGLASRVRVPAVSQEAPFLHVDQGGSVPASSRGLSWMTRPLVRLLVDARGRW